MAYFAFTDESGEHVAVGRLSDWKAAVLLVDDHPGNLLALEAVLAPLDLKLVRASSGPEALRRVAAEPFALVLLDLRMPGLDGVETAARMREQNRERQPPIIMITGEAPEMRDVSRAYERGIVDFMQKPFAPELLRAKVSVFAEIARQREKLLRYEQALRKRFEQQLVGIVSHDLRAPLNTILLGAEIGLRRPETDAKSRHTFEITKSAAGRAARLIHDLLDYTQVLSGAALPIKRVDLCLHDLIQRIVEELRLGHPNREFVVECTGSTDGYFDPDRLAQAVTNLATNATTYGGNRAISIRLVGYEAEVVIEVHNWGEPIPLDLLPRLFQPHQRGGSKPGRGSIGFGLFIVREVARAHGGTVAVESTQESGTSFCLRLPRASNACQSESTARLTWGQDATHENGP
jgi:signal transduction histidine kinase